MVESSKPDAQGLNFLAGGGEMGALIRAMDWAATPLGPPHRWPQSLKTAVRIMLTSRQPIWVGWGPQLIYLYNDAYQSIIGGKHPWALGKPTAEVWREIWTDIGPEVFGVRRDDAEVGLPLDRFVAGIHADDTARVMAAINRSMETGEPYEEEYRVHGAGPERLVVARGRMEPGLQGGQRMVS